MLSLSVSSYADEPTNNACVSSAIGLVNDFYECLYSKTISDKCYNLLDIAGKTSNTNNQKEIWNYIVANNSMFCTSRYLDGRFYNKTDFIKKSKITISFFNPRDTNDYTSGKLYITIASTLSDDGSDGVYKEISFPITKCDSNTEHKIEFYGIK
jgi:hypothetical protein